jgi:hypothetical protein
VQLREAADALGLIWQDTGLGLVLGDGGAFDGAADEVIVQTVGQVAAIEPVGPFPEITHQVLGADAVMGADEPGFDFAERLPFLFFGAGTFVDGDDPAFVGAGRCCVRDCSDRADEEPAPAKAGAPSASQKAAQRTGRSSLSSWRSLWLWSRPSDTDRRI